jgi:hypothetical protein
MNRAALELLQFVSYRLVALTRDSLQSWHIKNSYIDAAETNQPLPSARCENIGSSLPEASRTRNSHRASRAILACDTLHAAVCWVCTKMACSYEGSADDWASGPMPSFQLPA